MLIPTWVIWVLFWIVILLIAYRIIMKPAGDYDFSGPLVGVAIVMLAFCFTAGYWLAKFVGWISK